MMYQIEVHTTSESQETRIVRFNPKAVQEALENSFEDKIKVKMFAGFVLFAGAGGDNQIFDPALSYFPGNYSQHSN